MARWNSSNQILRYPLCCAIGKRSPRSKKQRRSRACKARNEVQRKMMSGRSGFIADGAEGFAGPFVTLRRSRTQDAARVEQLRGHTAKPHPYLFDPDESIYEFLGRCVGGDVHPVGVRWHLNDPWIFGRRGFAPQRPSGLRVARAGFYERRARKEFWEPWRGVGGMSAIKAVFFFRKKSVPPVFVLPSMR